MPINPIVTRPTIFPDNPRPVPIDFSWIGDLGKSIGQYREREEVGRILSGARDASGNLDLNKAATALAVSGRDPETYLKAATAAAGERDRAAAQRALEQHYKDVAAEAKRSTDIEQQKADQPQYHYVPRTLMDPGAIIEAPRKPGQLPIIHPWPGAAQPPATAPPAPRPS